MVHTIEIQTKEPQLKPRERRPVRSSRLIAGGFIFLAVAALANLATRALSRLAVSDLDVYQSDSTAALGANMSGAIAVGAAVLGALLLGLGLVRLASGVERLLAAMHERSTTEDSAEGPR